MGVEEIIIGIENHGLTLLVTGILIFYAVKALDVLFVEWKEKRKVKLHSEELKKGFSKTVQKNATVNQLLYKLLYKYDADKAYIFEYHNGGNSISGVPFLKASNTYEAVNENTPRTQNILKDLPISLFAFWNLKIINREKMFYSDTEEIKGLDIGLYTTLKQQNIKSIFVVGLYDAQGNPIGFLGLDFIKSKMDKVPHEMKKDMEIVSYKIAGFLY